MKRILAINVVILALAPVLSALLLATELATGVMPFSFSWRWIIHRSFAPVVWFAYTGGEALLLWILPAIFLILMSLAARKLWCKMSFVCAGGFDLCWVVIVHLFVVADVMGQC